MTRTSLHRRIRNGSLLMLVIVLLIGAVALPQVYRLGGAIRDTLYRNYLSIKSAQYMHGALYRTQLAQHDGKLGVALPAQRLVFDHWIGVELGDITENGEAALATDIDRRGDKLFIELAANPGRSRDAEFGQLHQRLDDLIKLNEDAMFRADSRANQLSARLTIEFAIGVALLLAAGVALAATLAWTVSKPLTELAERLRSFSLRGPSVRIGDQSLEELQAVASEFNRMAQRLEQFEQLNVDRLIYEKGKTEAIVESLEDGILLIDPKGAVTHINEVASIVLGVERDDALGSPFDDLNSNHPHYRRIREALHALDKTPSSAPRIEVDLHVRGRNHTYVLKPVPLRQGDGQFFGTLLILQDITYLRDQDRARTNLVATLSHELRTPLTSLALSAGLLERRREQLAAKDQELVTTIGEDLGRIRRLADDLLNLARGANAAITMRELPLDLPPLVDSVARTFALQAEGKSVALAVKVDSSKLQVAADPVKLSWAVSNLIANALRYTPAGGTISIGCDEAGGCARLTVTDSGPGIAPELRDHLFERYTQWNVNGVEPGSAGLGLAIVKEIVEAHGGRIFVDSETGRGTRFTVELPLRE